MEKNKEIFSPNSKNNSSLFNLAKDTLQEISKDIIKLPLKMSENKYEIIELKKTNDPFDFFGTSLKNNKTFPINLKTNNVTEPVNFVPIKSIPSVFLTFTNFINVNKIKISIFVILLFLFIMACFNEEFSTTIKNLLSNKDNKPSENNQKRDNNT